MRRQFLATLFAFGVALSAGNASAHSVGVSGASGKQSAASTCNSCHSGGTAPTLALTGPLTLAVGQSGTYTFDVTTNQVTTGMNAAATTGVTMAAGTNTTLLNGEVTHPSPVAPSGGKATYTFAITAPATPQSITIYAAGLAANGANGSLGDLDATTTLVVTITGDAGVDAGTDTGTDAGVDAGTDAGTDAGKPDAATDAGRPDAGDAGRDGGTRIDAGDAGDAASTIDSGGSDATVTTDAPDVDGSGGGSRDAALGDSASGFFDGPPLDQVNEGCSLTAGAAGAPGAWLLLLGLAALRRRRARP